MRIKTTRTLEIRGAWYFKRQLGSDSAHIEIDLDGCRTFTDVADRVREEITMLDINDFQYELRENDGSLVIEIFGELVRE